MLNRILPALLSGLLLAACAHSGVDMRSRGQAETRRVPATEAQLPGGHLDFRIAALDVLQIEVYPKLASEQARKAELATEIRIELDFRDSQYRITRGDLMTLELAGESDKTYDISVLPNGNIRLPRIGREVMARGLTPAELTARLEREYTQLLRKPKVVLSVQKSGLEELQKISATYTVDRDGRLILPRLGALPVLGRNAAEISAALSERASQEFDNRIEAHASLVAISSKSNDPRLAPDGQQYFRSSVKVSPDGTTFVPEAGNFQAAGKTLAELTEALQKAFARVYQNPVDVRIGLQESANLNVFIGGEVRSPGKYSIQNAQTLMQLISNAGWITEAADISKIVLLHAVAENDYVLYRTNLVEVIDGEARLRQDLRLSPRDIVIVPKSGVAQVNVWVDQYIRRMLPFTTSFTYSVSEVDDGKAN